MGSSGTECQKWLENIVKVANKVVVVTGGGAGMGREAVLEMLRRGAKGIAAVDIKQESLDETIKLAGANGSKISTHVVDISNLDQVRELPAAVLAKHGQVDGLLNVAGIIHPFHTVNDLTYEQIHKVFNVNFFGTVQMVKEFLPHLLARTEAQITNISSMGSYVPVPGQTIYGASKAAVKLFTEGLRSELAGGPVGVNLVFPGAVATNIAGNSGAMTDAEMKAMASNPEASKYKTLAPAVAGSIIVDGFESNHFHNFAGSDAKFMYRYSRLAPEAAAKLIQKQMANLLG